MDYDPSFIDGEGEEAEALRAARQARSEVVVICLDLRHSMREWLPLVGQLVNSFLKSKVIASATDQVGIVLYGTKESRNELPGLDHVYVLKKVQPLSAKLIRYARRHLSIHLSVYLSIYLSIHLSVRGRAC